MSIKTTLFNLALGVDMGLDNVPDLTLSAHTELAYLDGRRAGKILRPVINFVMRSPTHCQDALRNDLARAWAVVNLLTGYATRV